MTKHSLMLSGLLCTFLTACSTPMTSANTPASLAGDWQLYEANQTTLSHPKALLKFDAQQQRFHAYAGCNRLFGGYQQQEHTLKIAAVASTLMMCEPQAMENDRHVIRALESSVQYRIQGQQLELLNQQGQVVLKARR